MGPALAGGAAAAVPADEVRTACRVPVASGGAAADPVASGCAPDGIAWLQVLG